MRHKMEVLRRHCETEGRDYDEIERFCGLDLKPDRGQSGPIADASTLLERLGACPTQARRECSSSFPRPRNSDSIERFGSEVIAPASAG